MDMQEALDKFVAPILADKPHLALVIGTIDAGEVQVFGYGALNEQHPIRPTEASVFEIGSISKVFTSTLLALMVLGGQVTLDTPVKELLPQCPQLPAEITLRALATHTSGLPRLPANLTWSYLAHPNNPYVGYGEAQLLRYLARCRLSAKALANRRYLYSNLGVGLLGYVLASKAGTTYEELVTEKICRPLHMMDTSITLLSEQRERLATPHTAKGRRASNWDLSILAGAGGLRSTASDLLTFLKANMDDGQSQLTEAMHMCHEVQFEKPDPGFDGIGLAWHININAQRVYHICWHNGATGGYQSFAGFVKESRTGAVILANYSISTRDAFVTPAGFHVLRLLNGVSEE